MVLGGRPPPLDKSEKQLPHPTRCTLSQLRSGISVYLKSYMSILNPEVVDACPHCGASPHITRHLFDCASRFPGKELYKNYISKLQSMSPIQAKSARTAFRSWAARMYNYFQALFHHRFCLRWTIRHYELERARMSDVIRVCVCFHQFRNEGRPS